mmetsp:Transcript_97506/g.232119  ORF Transcript_97506/g.232119 Transcript_97506/m.232119 type:complete len:311 (-) Transcript_97506:1078-2010(-)
MPRCHSETAPSSAASNSHLLKKLVITCVSRFRAFFTRLRRAFSTRICGGGRARPHTACSSWTRATARSSTWSSSFNAPARPGSVTDSCKASSNFSSVSASSFASLSMRSWENSCTSRSCSISCFLAWASCLSFSDCSWALMRASSRCCSFFSLSFSSCFFCFSSAFRAFCSSFFSCCLFAASAAACSFFRCSSFFFLSSAFSAASFARSSACSAISFCLLASFSAALRLFCSSRCRSSSAAWKSSWESVGPLVVLAVSSQTFIGVKPHFSMAWWQRAAAPSTSFFLSASSMPWPSSRSASSSNWEHTVLI